VGARGSASGGPRTHAGDGETNALATEAFRVAANRMREAGFEVGGRIEVFVDPKLEVGGYSIRGEGDRFRIVASGRAVRSGRLDGLLLHEMSHIYRMRTNHPSHDSRIIEEATNRAAEGVATEDYQRKMLHDLVNNVEDLYADDIAFPLMRKDGLLTADQEGRLFQEWVEDRPAESRDATRVRWENAWSLANNARAIAEMERQGVSDASGIAAVANRRLMLHMDPSAPVQFEYLRVLLVSLKEDITPDEYRAILIDYLARFLAIARPELPEE